MYIPLPVTPWPVLPHVTRLTLFPAMARLPCRRGGRGRTLRAQSDRGRRALGRGAGGRGVGGGRRGDPALSALEVAAHLEEGLARRLITHQQEEEQGGQWVEGEEKPWAVLMPRGARCLWVSLTGCGRIEVLLLTHLQRLEPAALGGFQNLLHGGQRDVPVQHLHHAKQASGSLRDQAHDTATMPLSGSRHEHPPESSYKRPYPRHLWPSMSASTRASLSVPPSRTWRRAPACAGVRPTAAAPPPTPRHLLVGPPPHEQMRLS